MLYVKEGFSHDLGKEVHDIDVTYYIKTEELMDIDKKIVSILEKKYKYGKKKKVKWGNWWDYDYASEYWGVFKPNGELEIFLCYFNSPVDKQPFWGITGGVNISVMAKDHFYEIKYHDDKWDGTFESDELKTILLSKSTNAVDIVKESIKEKK